MRYTDNKYIDRVLYRLTRFEQQLSDLNKGKLHPIRRKGIEYNLRQSEQEFEKLVSKRFLAKLRKLCKERGIKSNF